MPCAGDRRANQFSERLERVDLGRRPLAFKAAFVESDQAPPLAVDKHRNGHYRFDVSLFEQAASGGPEIAGVADDRLAPCEPRRPELESDFGHGLLYFLVIDRR